MRVRGYLRLYTAMLYMQSIEFKEKEEIPSNPARRLLKQGDFTMVYNTEVSKLFFLVLRYSLVLQFRFQ